MEEEGSGGGKDGRRKGVEEVESGGGMEGGRREEGEEGWREEGGGREGRREGVEGVEGGTYMYNYDTLFLILVYEQSNVWEETGQPMNCIVSYCIVLYFIAFYCIALYCIILHCIILHCIVYYCIELRRRRANMDMFYSSHWLLCFVQHTQVHSTGMCVCSMYKHSLYTIIAAVIVKVNTVYSSVARTFGKNSNSWFGIHD